MVLDNNAGNSLKQLLSYITKLIHKSLSSNIKLINSLKTGIINILSHQKLIIEKLKRLEDVEDRLEGISAEQREDQQRHNNMFHEIKNMKLIVENFHNKSQNIIKEKISSVESSLIQKINEQSVMSNQRLINLIQQQLETDSQEKLESIKSNKGIKQEKIKSRAGIWVAIIMGLLSSGGVVIFILSKMLGG